MAEQLATKMTVEEFFAWQARRGEKFEFVDGVPVATAKLLGGVVDSHDRIQVNAIAHLSLALRTGPYRMRTDNLGIHTSRGLRRPDLFVECGKPGPHDMAADQPRVVIEVLSPSTIRFNRFQKLAEYQQHPSIRVILLVDSEAPQVTVWRRDGERWSTEQLEGLGAVLALPEIDTDLPLADLYFDVEFDAA